MSTSQKPKSRIVVVILLVLLSLSTLMCLVYGMVQRTVAMKSEEHSFRLEKEKMELLNQNRELVQKLEATIVEVQLARKTAQENLEICAKLKKK